MKEMTYQSDVFRGQVALVTGGTSGIGEAIARQLARLGAQVVAAGLGSDKLRADEEGLSAVELNVTDPAGVDRVLGGLEKLNILVNGAGVLRGEAEHQMDVFNQVVDIHLSGTMRMCVGARSLLRETKGCIVNTASMTSFIGGWGQAPGYTAAKGGVMQLTKSLACAYAPDGIRVNAVAPGWIATPLTQSLQEDAARSAMLLGRTPLGRWGTPEDVAQGVAFLCTPAAGFITGVILPIDGGFLVG